MLNRRAVLGGFSLAAISLTEARAQSSLGAPAAPASAGQAPKLDDTTSTGFNRIVIARWGDGVLPDAPPFDPNRLTGAQADTQFPYDGVIAGLINPPAAQDGIPRLVMVLANPTAPARMVFPDGADNPDIAGRLQGATIMNLQYLSGRWVTVDGGYQSRRIADGTLCQISGPVAASIGQTVQGLLAPSSGCATPWATALLAEGDAGPWLTRLAGMGFGYADPTDAPRFGWVAELDPLDPSAFPVKRTALGRLTRSGIAATTTPDGRAVIFFSQNDPAGFLFRFIAATNATDGTALDSGTLSVAQISDSSITWIDLGTDIPSLVGTVGAASSAGGSPFDAPGGIAIAPGNSAIYLACAGNPARDASSTNALNPRAGDDNGHILVFAPPNGDVTAKTFTGNLAIAAGNPASAQFTQYTQGSNAWFTKPHTLNLDSLGQLWIGTNQHGKISDTADGLFIMQTGGPSQYLITTAYLAPIGAAIGGAAFDVNTKTTFGMVRHPGATPQASFDAPATRWPTLQPSMPPQSTVIGLVSPAMTRIIRQVAFDGPDFDKCFEIRRVVFVEEQHVPIEEEHDEYDATALHFLATLDDKPLGTARVLLKESAAKITRVAVLRAARKQGIGEALMRHIESAVPVRRFTLTAQLHALPFYERLGYIAEGEVFMEAGIPHRDMAKGLL